MDFKTRLPMFLLTGLFLLLSFFTSSCYWARSMSGEGYQGGHVYMLKMLAEGCDFDYTEDQQPLDYRKKAGTLYVYDLGIFHSYNHQDKVKQYEELSSQGYSIGGETYRMIWQDEWRKEISFALLPGTLFRIKSFFWDFENETRIYATVLNGPMAGKEIEVGGLGYQYWLHNVHEDLIDYPAGKTHPFWLKTGKGDRFLDPDLVQDLGKLSDAELKEKGLWLEPGTEAAEAVAKQLPEGVDLDALENAAEQDDVAAQVQLGKLYYAGAGVRTDFVTAEHWLQKAADHGSREAEFLLAVMNAGNNGKRGQEAEEVIRERAESGDREAQFCFGLMLETKYDKAVESVVWYRKAADQGDARAQRALGAACATGRGAKQDYEQAAEWFRKAAEQGDFAAQRNLGYLYLHGEGVEKDNAEARKWLEKAAAQGDVYAAELLNELEQ